MEQQTTKITLGFVMSWILGVVLSLFGLILAFSQTVSGLLLAVAGILLLPPFNHVLRTRFKLSLSGGLKSVLVLILVVIAIMTTSPDNTPSAQENIAVGTPETQNQVIAVTATKLLQDYEANEVAADAQYKGNIVEISGTISTIGKDILDTPYVALSTGTDNFFSVQCMFEKSDQAQLATLSKDSKITLRGRVSGKLGNVLVRGCVIVR